MKYAMPDDKELYGAQAKQIQKDREKEDKVGKSLFPPGHYTKKSIEATTRVVVELITQELDGKKIAYSSETMFYVQVGRGPKGAYKARYAFKGNLTQAVLYFNGINIGRGYKKRLRMETKTLARVAS